MRASESDTWLAKMNEHVQNKFIRHYSKKCDAHEAPIFKYKRLGGGGEEVVVALKLKASGEMAKTCIQIKGSVP